MYNHNLYLNYNLDYNKIRDLINKYSKKRINIFIDLNSVCKGFYKTETVLYELGEYATHNVVSGVLIEELRKYLNKLYYEFKNYDPYFIIFYDNGECIQNRLIIPTYKANRNIYSVKLSSDQREMDLFRTIRKYYYRKIEEEFNKPDLCSVQFIESYETDIVPYYCLKYGIFDSLDNDVLNIILSVDKDLLQTCDFKNTIQCITNFKAINGKYRIQFDIYDDVNALSYIHKNFSPGILTSKYISLVLAISGDTSDGILGIKGVGPAKAIKVIEKNDIPHNLDKLKQKINELPLILQNNFDLLIRNLKVISFEEQMKRLPKDGFLKK